ncbi:hypothetical protein H0H92_007211 [Tricholoma furcatifolium]|nr:hypothetical protein H0H92_007211 [Tricholoma furcatifolium]
MPSPLSSPEIRNEESESQDRFSYKMATHAEIFDDLISRFLLNLPDEELNSLERICFQVEQAHWYYEDFIREENPNCPSLPLKKFSQMLFKECPLLERWSDNHEMVYNTFMEYKTKVPVCGAIMLNDSWDKCVLVKGWKSSSGWGFPKGKINQTEPPANCAIREVLEETGYNLAGQLNPNHVIETNIRDQKITLFIVPGVPEDYPFKTKTRKEISKIEWFRLADLPTWKRNKTATGRFYLIAPFIGSLKAFINANKPRALRKTPKLKKAQPVAICSEPVQSTAANDRYYEYTSQPSSAENGEPHSPSAIYSKSSTGQTSRVTNESMDPHLAHLMSALVSSASTMDNKPEVLSDPGLSVSKVPRMSSERSETLAQPVEKMPELHPSHDKPSNLLTSSTVEVAPSTASSPLATGVLSFQGMPAAAAATNSPRYIALLDAVSEESARLRESYKTAAANGLPINVNDNFKHPTNPTTASQSLQGLLHTFQHPTGSIPSAMPHVNNVYVSGHLPLFVSQGPHVLRSSGPALAHSPQERPMTSAASPRGPLNPNLQNGSMNQSQLLALMNGTSITPSAAYGYPSQPIANQPPAPLFTPALEQFPFSTPQSAPSLSPGHGHPSRFPNQTLPPANNALLSILNSGRSASRLPQLPPYSTSQS